MSLMPSRRRAAVAAASLLVLGLGACSGGGEVAGAPSSSAEESAEEPAPMETASETSSPTPPPTPTPTAMPTPTPTPTSTPEPEPDPNAFEPTTVTGTGASVVPVPASLGTITVSHDGSSNLALWAMDGANEQVDLLVNEIGSYAGTVPWGFRDEDIASIQVEADGNWSLTFAPISAAPVLTMPASGTGDAVLLYQGEAATPTFTHDGASNFAVWIYSSSADLLINEIGAYSGTHAMRAGPAFVVIEADGAWTVG